MRKIKGIMLNGEWLGDNVAINSYFKAICGMSSQVMYSFVKLINNLEELDETVEICGFSFANKNDVIINFENSKITGLAKLYFAIKSGAQTLIDSEIKICNINDVNLEKEDFYQSETVDYEDIDSVEEDLVEKDFSTTNEILQDKEGAPAQVCCEVEEKNNVAVAETNIIEVEEMNSIFDVEDVEKSSNISMSDVIEEPTQELAEVQCISNKITEEPSHNVDTMVKPSMHSDFLLMMQKFDALQEFIARSITAGELKLGNLNTDEEVLNKIFDKTIQASNDVVSQEKTVNYEKLSENIHFDEPFEEQKIEKSIEVSNSENELEELSIDEDDEKESLIDDEDEEAIFDNEISEIDEAYSEFVERYDDLKPHSLDLSGLDSAVSVTSEELSTLKSILSELQAKKIESGGKFSIEDFFASQKENTTLPNRTDDFDFKILDKGESYGASIVDTDLFVAGKKLYKWGDTLFLEE